MITEQTPIEKYEVEGKEIYVKREDLYSGGEAPSLAKLRGIKKRVAELASRGVETIGILDTRISKSGWGLAYLVKNKKIKVICFYPRLKTEREMPFIQKRELALGARVFPLKAGRTNVLYYKAKKELLKIDGKGFMMPMGLVLKETKDEVSKLITPELKKYKSFVVVCGTGTIFSGIIVGIDKLYEFGEKKPTLYGVSCGMSIYKISKRIEKLLGYKIPENVVFIEGGYSYYDEENIETPFPSSPYYDKKAWKWLLNNYNKLEKPILFWNVGV